MSLEELKISLEKEKTPWDKWEYWLWWPYRFWHNQVKDFPRKVKWFCQRGWRGYADCDVWSLDWYLTSWLPRALRDLAKNKNGCPADFYDDSAKDDECHKWTEALEQMAYGFELHHKWEDDYVAVVGETRDGKEFYDFNDPEWKAKFDAKQQEVEKAFEKSMELFTKYFHNLWD